MLTDTVFAALVGFATIAGYLSADVSGSERPQDALGALVIVGQAVAFAFRRRWPIPSFLAVSALTIAFWVADYPTNFDVVSMLAVYSAIAHGGSDRVLVWRVVGVVVAAMTAIAVAGVISPTEDLPPAAVIGIAAIHLTAAIAGEIVQERRARLIELEQRAIRAETERTLLARQAVLDERSRIARDLHDVVAHAMTVMVVQAGAAERVVSTEPEAAVEALGHIQSAGRAALADMRRMLGVLRDETSSSTELSPQPTMSELGTVIRRCNDAGVHTELLIDGDGPSGAIGPEMAAYRIVQEALTNVIKHAGRPANAIVKVQYSPDRIRLEVMDDGVGATEAMLARATGHGLVGMRERVDVYDGELHAGPRPGGGFRVAAVIPLEAVPEAVG